MNTIASTKNFEPNQLLDWSVNYHPWTTNDGKILPAFEILDGSGDRLLESNEDCSESLQDAASTLASYAPRLFAFADDCVMLLADFDGHIGEEGELYQRGCLLVDQLRPIVTVLLHNEINQTTREGGQP